MVIQYNNLLVLVAMEREFNEVLKCFPETHDIIVSKRLGIYAKEYNIKKYKFIITQSGVGTVNAALATALIAEQYPLDAILLLGVAGALQDFLKIGDIVLASKVLQHDSIWSGKEQRVLMAPGKLFVSLNQKDREKPEFMIDTRFFTLLKSLLESNPRLKFHTGSILSGNEFVGDFQRKVDITKIDPHALAVEMESAGVAQVAKKLGIPFAVIKTIADRLNPAGSISGEYNNFIQLAAENSMKVVDLLICRDSSLRSE